MSIRHGLLALLAERPMYGYQLRAEFETRTGSTWPLNIGQVYTTLQRLERDGLVEPADTAGYADDQTAVYQLTETGRAETEKWWSAPVTRHAPARDELAIKLALAVTLPGVDVQAVVQRQRTETMRAVQQYTRLSRRADEANDTAWLLVLDSLVFAAEAEIRWLDHVEARLERAARRAARTDASPSGAPPPATPTTALSSPGHPDAATTEKSGR